MWRLVSNVLPTKVILASRMGKRDTSCTLCGQEDEDTLHPFKQCPIVRAIGFASQWSLRLVGFAGDSIKEVIKLLPGGAEQPKTLLMLTCLWYLIWYVRNAMLFKGPFDIKEAVWSFERMVVDFSKGTKERLTTPAARTMIKWKPPCPGRLSINIDASIGGGLYASAMIVRNHSGNLIFLCHYMGGGMLPIYG